MGAPGSFRNLGAPLQERWANLHRLAALQSWWPVTLRDHSQGRGRHHQHPHLMQKMRVLHLPQCGTGPLQPPPWQCSQPLVLPGPNSHPTTSSSTPNSCHPTAPASICGGGHHYPSHGLHSWLILQTPWLSPSSLPGTPRPLWPCCGDTRCTGPTYPRTTWVP